MNRKEKVILYGASARLDYNYHGFKAVYDIVGISDSDLNKKEKIESLGEKYIAPDEISSYEFDKIYVTSVYYKEILITLANYCSIDRNRIFPDTNFFSEKEFSLGDLNPDKTFYIFRRPDPSNIHVGLFGNVLLLVRLMNFLKDKNYEIFVDFQNYKNIFLEDSKLGKENGWEYFYKQPCGETCENVYKSKNVILGMGFINWNFVSYRKGNEPSASDSAAADKSLNDYFVLSEYMQEQIDADYDRLFRPIKERGQKICAVYYRGTEYTKFKPYLHEIQPTIPQAVEKTKELMSEWGFDYIYFESEDNKAFKAFAEAFADRMIYSERPRIDEYPDTIFDYRFDRENDKFLKTMEYARACYLAAKCDFLISGRCSGAAAIMSISKGFEKEYLFSLGLYGVDDDAYYDTPDRKPIYVTKHKT